MTNILRITVSGILIVGALALDWFIISPSTASWYDWMMKPLLAPPAWGFALILLAFAILLAIVFNRICGHDITDRCRRWYSTFLAQLSLVLLWALFFFVFHSLSLSIVFCVVLWFSVIILTALAWEIDRTSFWLLIPYVAWTTFVVVLSIEIWWVN